MFSLSENDISTYIDIRFSFFFLLACVPRLAATDTSYVRRQHRWEYFSPVVVAHGVKVVRGVGGIDCRAPRRDARQAPIFPLEKGRFVAVLVYSDFFSRLAFATNKKKKKRVKVFSSFADREMERMRMELYLEWIGLAWISNFANEKQNFSK